jgi:glycosyltransferase involved in cell wall biosynthesis
MGGSNPLKVALLSDYPLDEAIAEGGIQSVAQALAQAMARHDDIECHIVCSARGAREGYQRHGQLHVHYIPRPPLPQLLTERLLDVRRLLGAVNAISPHIVHGEGQERHGLAAVRSGRQHVVAPHGVVVRESTLKSGSRPNLKGLLRKSLMDRTELEVFRRARNMIILSEYLPHVYGDMLSSRIEFIENPIAPEFFDLKNSREAGRFLFVGTVVARKRVADIVEAFSSLVRYADVESDPTMPEISLRIVGPLWDSDYAKHLGQTITRLGLDARVEITGPVSQSKLMEEFGSATALVLASVEETAPQVIAQSMACGLPVVASRAGGIPFMVKDGVTALLFEPGDVNGCASQLRRLLTEPGMAEALAKQGRAEALARFHPDSVADQTISFYRRILNNTD